MRPPAPVAGLTTMVLALAASDAVARLTGLTPAPQVAPTTWSGPVTDRYQIASWPASWPRRSGRPVWRPRRDGVNRVRPKGPR
jgi:hypothetical protein